MEKKSCVFFDLDGTLTDPKEGITKSVQYALRHYGIEVEDLDSLIPFIGPPLVDSYMEYYGFTLKQAREGVLVYREYFNEKGWKENREYPGIRELLAELKSNGVRLFVATSKPEVYGRRILEYFGMAEYFELIGGASLDESRVRKADVIRYVLEKAGIPGEKKALGSVVMVGDRKHDILGARECGIECIGVLYGYGDREELSACRADAIAETVESLGALLRSLCYNQES